MTSNPYDAHAVQFEDVLQDMEEREAKAYRDGFEAGRQDFRNQVVKLIDDVIQGRS